MRHMLQFFRRNPPKIVGGGVKKTLIFATVTTAISLGSFINLAMAEEVTPPCCTPTTDGSQNPPGCRNCGTSGSSDTGGCSPSDCAGSVASSKEYTDVNNRKYTCKLKSKTCWKQTSGCGGIIVGGGDGSGGSTGDETLGVSIYHLLNKLSPVQSAYANDFVTICECHWVGTYGDCTCNTAGYALYVTDPEKEDQGYCRKMCTGDGYANGGWDCVCKKGYYHPVSKRDAFGNVYYSSDCEQCPSSNTIILNNQESYSLKWGTQEGMTDGLNANGIESCYLNGVTDDDTTGTWETEEKCYYVP